ncbi:SGNH/GDSL hydrolase family protein [archaeon]|nr:SGNH/GDSL hydrolase family protein [archaeon]MBL7057078.1 SGNH/GDSL hydrolase family protein [Candidatus Woesearchaeota archaeon]
MKKTSNKESSNMLIKILKSRIFLTIITIIIVLAILEIILTIRENPSYKSDRFEILDNPILGYRGTETVEEIITNPNGSKEVLGRNSLGFRDKERSFENKNNQSRIVVLGDSVMLGEKVRANESIPSLLNKKTQQTNEQYEFINLAQNGYTAVQELEILKMYGIKYDPELVIIGYVINDAGTPDNGPIALMQGHREAINWKNRILKQAGMPRSCEVKNFFNKFMIVKEFQTKINNLKPNNNKSSVYNLWSPYYKDQCEWGTVEYAFLEIAKISKEKEFEVLLVIMPFMWMGEDISDLQEIYDLVRAEGEKNGFHILSLVEPIEEQGFSNMKFDSYHFSIEGNKFSSDIIFEEVQKILK